MSEETQKTTSAFWKRKLIAFLHDPPDKCFDIKKHEELAESYINNANFDSEELPNLKCEVKPADHFAAAAERFVFPKGKCATTFTGRSGECFIHPLCSAEHKTSGNFIAKRGEFAGILADAIGGIGVNDEDWRKKHFLHWRRWMENAITNAERGSGDLAFLPADTRIPDHSIWNHIAVTSAFASCLENGKIKPALLLFQLGPVQDFIAQARSTRDLWSGSYLLSWLMASAMKAVSDQIGPDSIIFPSLRGNGIFDALHREEIYDAEWMDKNERTMTTWQRMLEEKNKIESGRAARWLLTPTLPNRFLALVPESRAAELAEKAADAIRNELGSIGDAVWKWLEREASESGAGEAEIAGWRKRWDYQIEQFPKITWAVQKWLSREECLAEFAELPVNKAGSNENNTPLETLEAYLDLAEKHIPRDDRDPRYYVGGDDGPRETLNNPGVLWSAHYALVDAKLAARRNTRDFDAWSDDTVDPKSKGSVKDSLSGAEESIGSEKFWEHLNEKHEKLFKAKSHAYGAMNLIKRLWCRDEAVPYLREKLDLSEKEFGNAIKFDSMEDVARGNEHGGPYVAVIAMDGDEMGKWVSGENLPKFLDQLSAKAKEYLEKLLENHGIPDLKRLLTPSYHLQFSEALANFATWIAETIVREHNGQLVYAGGDDVLAILPADRAIECAKALRNVFTGTPPENQARYKLAVVENGFLLENAGYPLTMPGTECDVSAGIAVGHQHAPLQMLVREAQNAEKRAKNDYGRAALAISLYKRSGEIIEWGCKWEESSALELMKLVTELSPKKHGDDAPLSNRFPYALAELLAPYSFGRKLPENMFGVVMREFDHVLSRQGDKLKPDAREKMLCLAERYLKSVADGHMEDFVNLFLVETFINRFRGEA